MSESPALTNFLPDDTRASVSTSWGLFATHAKGCECEPVLNYYISTNQDRTQKINRAAQAARLCEEGRPLFEKWLYFVALAVEQARYPGRRAV